MNGHLPCELRERAWSIAERARATVDQGDPRDFPLDAFQLLTGCGFLTLPITHELGALGLGHEAGTQGALLELLAILGWGDLSLARLYEGHINALLLIQQFGNPEQIERAAADARNGLIFGVWNTEGEDGLKLDVQMRLQGGKTFASGAGTIERPLVTARDANGGWQMLLLDMERMPSSVDHRSWRTFGMRGSQSYAIDLTGARIEPQQRIGTDGDYYRQPWFSGGAIRFCAAQLGAATALLDLARAELVARDRAGDPMQRARIGHISGALASGMSMLETGAELADRSRFGGGPCSDDERLLTWVGLTRTAIERACLETIELVEQSLGAGSLMATHPAGRIGADLRLYLRQPAPDAVLLGAADTILSAPQPFMRIWNSEGTCTQ